MSKFKAAISKWCKCSPNRVIKNNETISKEKVRPFNEIPGPEALPVIGNTFRFLPGVVMSEITPAQFSTDNTEKMLQQLHDKYGDIARLEGLPFKRPMVFLFSPSLAKEMYEKEGKWPTREGIDGLKHYYDVQKRHTLGTSQGQEWRCLRTKVNKVILNLPYLNSSIEKIDEVTLDFTRKMRAIRDAESLELPDDFLDELKKLALETIFLVAVGHRLGCVRENLSKVDDAESMIDESENVFAVVYKLEKSPLWKLLGNTPKLRQLFQVKTTLSKIMKKHVDRAIEERLGKQSIPGTSNLTMLERLSQHLSEELAETVVTQDVIGGAIDTVANTVAKALYAVATDPRVQTKLFVELKAALPDVTSPFTEETYRNVPYLKACLKETYRLFPSVLGNTRTTTQDIALGGFRIPKEVRVFIAHGIMSQRSEQFPEPEKFIPERWMDDGNVRTTVEAHGYSVLPFGKGPRACVARYLAAREMTIFIARIVRAFELQWRGGDLRIQHHMISTVQSPLKIKVTDR